MVMGDPATAANNIVALKALTLSCALNIGTYSASKTSGTNWYTSTFTTNVDCNGQTENCGKFQSFIPTQLTMPTLGQHAARSTTYDQGATGVAADMWLFLTKDDKVDGRLASKREFPFDSSQGSTTGKSMYVRAYGSGLKTATTLTVTIPASATFDASGSYRGNANPGLTFALDSGYTTKAAGSTANGLIEFEFASGTWGGTCCADGSDCTTCDLTTGNLKLFSTLKGAEIGQISHSHTNSATPKLVALVSFAFNGVMDIPAHLTTVRGRGGLGSANQKLLDIFFTLTSNVASSSSIQALMHFYVGVATAKTDA